MTEKTLDEVVNAVCLALRGHADSCREDPNDIATVIRNGEALVQAVLDYERALAASTGWSMPIRHLGPLPIFGAYATATDGNRGTGGDIDPARMSVQVDVRYRLRVIDADALVALASGRFASEISGLKDAIELLVKSEGWDPSRYPPSMVRAGDAKVMVSLGDLGDEGARDAPGT